MEIQQVNRPSKGRWRATEMVKIGRKSRAITCYGKTKAEAIVNLTFQIKRERWHYQWRLQLLQQTHSH